MSLGFAHAGVDKDHFITKEAVVHALEPRKGAKGNRGAVHLAVLRDVYGEDLANVDSYADVPVDGLPLAAPLDGTQVPLNAPESSPEAFRRADSGANLMSFEGYRQSKHKTTIQFSATKRPNRACRA